ncbi:disease resistance protein RPM1-like [Hibiscus syriacus]|uniref:disease resistance protein RPM1-like n=1 Tax=Hibiscus syriacus TaxID=106335 RepID=UPI0019212A9F|nr:disease resistance protein RPM1-like [Hibiscus syriacus]
MVDEPGASKDHDFRGGMGGLGKTTLVANTFNKQVVKQHFDCCAWITVSRQYVVTELFKSMIKELYHKAQKNIDPAINLDSMSYQDLVYALVNFLQPRRYLIVLDDVWSIELWQDISMALPVNMNGSRILLTTRKEDVISFEFGVANHILRLKNLPFDESLTLFCNKAFERKGGQCPPYLVSSARKLVAKCEGLPLAIVALGGLMATKNSIAEWNEVYNNLNKELSENDSYFERLRGLLQVVRRTGSGRPKACKMHDILLEFAVSISKMEKFVAKSDGKEVEYDGIRRWSITAKAKEMKAGSKTALSRVRSLLLTGFKLMRVLDLEDTPIDELPDELVNLFNLRYLNLTRTQVKELPKSIGNLYNLQSLVMKKTQIKEIPAGIVKLKNLRHLIAYRFCENQRAFDFCSATA